jgi:hypothetical protein
VVRAAYRVALVVVLVAGLARSARAGGAGDGGAGDGGVRTGGATEARDDGVGELIAMFPVETVGVSKTARDKFEQGVEEGLRGVGFQVMRSDSLGKAMAASSSFVEGCDFGPCMRAVYDATHVRLVLVARIHGIGRSYSFVVSLIDTRTGQQTSQVARACPMCTVEDAITTATLATIELVTGMGDATVTDPGAGPIGNRLSAQTIAPSAVARERRLMRRTGWAMVGLGVGLTGLGLALRDHDHGPATATGGVALGAAGGVVLLFSHRLAF